jgi:hypothetical protein
VRRVCDYFLLVRLQSHFVLYSSAVCLAVSIRLLRDCPGCMGKIEQAHGQPSAEMVAPWTIPVVHCMKSASFGSSLFVEFKGDRSPDLSCTGRDSHSGELQKDANQILQAAREAAGIPSRRAITRPVPNPPK